MTDVIDKTKVLSNGDFRMEQPLKHFREIMGLFEVVSSAPSHQPKRFYDQIKIYKSGATRRLYWYDQNAGEWVYVAGSV